MQVAPHDPLVEDRVLGLGLGFDVGAAENHLSPAAPPYSAATLRLLLAAGSPSRRSMRSSSSFITPFSFLTRASPSLPSSLKVVSGGRTSPTGIAGGRGQRLGIALVPVGRMALGDEWSILVIRRWIRLASSMRPSVMKSQMRYEARGM